MSRPRTKAVPLRNMREAANISLERAADYLGLGVKYFRKLEYDGTEKYQYIRALATLYGQAVDDVAEAAKPARENIFTQAV